MNSRLATICFLLLASSACFAVDFPVLPFTRQLSAGITGKDVLIAQTLLHRALNTSLTANFQPLVFNDNVATAVAVFQKNHGLPVTKVVDAATATALLEYISDGYRDVEVTKKFMKDNGYKYKFYIPVFKNRSIEVTAYLQDADFNVLYKFTARLRGQDQPNHPGVPLNQLSSNGETPSGLWKVDLASPVVEDPEEYGPYPITIAAEGIEGNAKLVQGAPLNLADPIRFGFLIHTGEWPNWDPSKPMPNSHGCVHAHPADINNIWQILNKKLGVEIRPINWQLPYPYKPQGLLSIEQID